MSEDGTKNLNAIEESVHETGQILDLDKIEVLILGVGLIIPVSGTIKIEQSDDLKI